MRIDEVLVVNLYKGLLSILIEKFYIICYLARSPSEVHIPAKNSGVRDEFVEVCNLGVILAQLVKYLGFDLIHLLKRFDVVMNEWIEH